MSAIQTYNVYVPKPGRVAHPTLSRGHGIVGYALEESDDKLVIFNCAEQATTYGEKAWKNRVRQAAWLALRRKAFPAFVVVVESDMLCVAKVHIRACRPAEIIVHAGCLARSALAAWCQDDTPSKTFAFNKQPGKIHYGN